MIVPIVALKGGVGKSTISLNMAYEFSKYEKTLLIDTDPQNSLATFLCTDFKKGFADILFDRLKVKEVIKTPISDNNNFLFIPSGIKGFFHPIHYEELFVPEVISSIFDEINNLDIKFIVIDTPPRISKQSETILSLSDYFIIITTPDPASFASLHIFLKYLKQKELDNYFIIINKVKPDKISEDFNLIIQAKAPNKVIGFLPEDNSIIEAEGMCEPISKINPESSFIIALKEIVHEFLLRIKSDT